MSATVVERIAGFIDGVFGVRNDANTWSLPDTGQVDIEKYHETLALLRKMYFNNGLYRDRMPALYDLGLVDAKTKGLRTFQHALVEFYVATTMPGTLDQLPIGFPAIDADDEGVTNDALAQQHDRIRQRIEQVHRWSNWAIKKQRYIREQATTGESFIYVGTNASEIRLPRDARVYLSLYEPEYVTDLDTDDRGHLTYIRLDIPRVDRGAPDRPYVHTEIWWKARDLYQVWHTPRGIYTYKDATSRTPVIDDKMQADHMIDFVPFTQAKHVDTGEPRGMAPIVPAIEKMDELNAKATEASARLYRHGKADLALEGAGGQIDGMYTPPPKIQKTDAGTVELNGETMWTIPPGYTLKHLIANLDFEAHYAGLRADMDHIRETDMPDLAYYIVSSASAGMSGDALEMMLTAAAQKVRESRGNAEAELVRAENMALTIGQNAKIPGFEATEIGTWEQGSFEHWYLPRPVIMPTVNDESLRRSQRATSTKQFYDAGYSRRAAAILAGIPEAEVDAAEKMEAETFEEVEL